ncbi:hypothetical protein [Diaphorobacter sp. LR2014-1]|uniref:hypothetical protein n=1 Tax=Diaphorobacter sp. LR2014-1 TaxID=1933219 RepID=UPI00155F0B83|nr:hypothetical protein [Diaphorobacter sp. LR2014-1]
MVEHDQGISSTVAVAVVSESNRVTGGADVGRYVRQDVSQVGFINRQGSREAVDVDGNKRTPTLVA